MKEGWKKEEKVWLFYFGTCKILGESITEKQTKKLMFLTQLSQETEVK